MSSVLRCLQAPIPARCRVQIPCLRTRTRNDDGRLSTAARWGNRQCKPTLYFQNTCGIFFWKTRASANRTAEALSRRLREKTSNRNKLGSAYSPSKKFQWLPKGFLTTGTTLPAITPQAAAPAMSSNAQRLLGALHPCQVTILRKSEEPNRNWISLQSPWSRPKVDTTTQQKHVRLSLFLCK